MTGWSIIDVLVFHMSAVLAISVPFFALILCGFLTRHVGLFTQSEARTLSKFAFYVALPPMLFVKVAAGDATTILNWGFVWRYETATIVIFLGGAWLARRLFTVPRLASGIYGLNVAYPNYGYMGVPLAILAFGDAAALPMALILFADTIVLLALTAYFVADSQKGLFASIGDIVTTMAKNPLLISVVAGLLFSASGLQMPELPDRFLNLLAGAAAPIALVALGTTLYGQPLRGAVGELSSITLLKLVLHPVLVAVMFLAIPGQDILWVKVAILSACLPVAANVFMLADHYGAYAGRSASAILASTIGASVTVPIILYFLFGL